MHVPVALPAFTRRAFLKRATAFDPLVGTRCRLLFPPFLRARVSRTARLCLPLMGSPRDTARQLDTALDIRSGVDPCERMALRHRTDPSLAPRLDLAADTDSAPEASAIATPMTAEMRDRDGSHVHF